MLSWQALMARSHGTDTLSIPKYPWPHTPSPIPAPCSVPTPASIPPGGTRTRDGQMLKEISDLFRALDRNSDGQIEKPEFSTGLRPCGLLLMPMLAPCHKPPHAGPLP